jgi:N-acetylmuramoyl-L-alanine amidase
VRPFARARCGRAWVAAAICPAALAVAGCGSSTAVTAVTTVVTAAPTTTADTSATDSAATPGTNSAPAPAATAAPRRASPPRKARVRPLPLAGETVGVDPGHNGRNYTDPGYIDHLIWNGRESEACNTTGTETDGGYTEAQFNFNVAMDLSAELHRLGARVVLTRHTNTGVGPCVNRRAAIINRAHAAVAIDIHADGGPASGRGVAILEPVADGPNDRIIGASRRFGADLLSSYTKLTGMPVSTYDGLDGISFRDDLAGLNLTRVPEVLIETGNMRNATDASLLTSDHFQHLAAAAMTQAIERFLHR